MEDNLQHGEGDLEGEPYRLAPHLVRGAYRWFEYDDDTGLYLANKGLLGYPKGSVKTEFAAGLALEHLEGPSRVSGTAVTTVAAVDGDQSKELLRIAGMMIPEGSALDSALEANTELIKQRVGSGRIVASTAALGKNDGKRTSFLVNDEIHEWDAHSAAGAKRHGILERNTFKRANGRQLNITTAGWDLETLAGAMYKRLKAIALEGLVDRHFMGEWWEAGEHYQLEDYDQLVAAIQEANPMANPGGSVHWEQVVANLVRSYDEHRLRGEVNDFIRYHLNRWVGVLEDVWMDMEVWHARYLHRNLPPAGSRIVLGFDGSERGDATALIGASIEKRPHLFVVRVWERPPGEAGRDWSVPYDAVSKSIEDACEWWNVDELAADTAYWQGELDRLHKRGVPVVGVTQSTKVMAPKAMRLYEAVMRDMVSHDGSEMLSRHVANCRRYENDEGVRIVKEHTKSKRYIDAAIAAVMAHDRAAQLAYEPEHEWPSAELV